MKNRLLCVLLAAAVAGFGAGCSNGQSSSSGVSSAPSSAPTSSKVEQLGGDAPFHKFDQPVTVHIGMSVDPTDKTLPAGDSADNNQYTRYLKDNYNIVVKADWTAASGSNFDQKVSLCIASSNLPDAVVVSNRTYMTKAAGSGLLYDITDLFQQYQSKQVITRLSIPSATSSTHGFTGLVSRASSIRSQRRQVCSNPSSASS